MDPRNDRTWVVRDMDDSEDGVETYRGTNEQDARQAFALLLVSGKACRLEVAVNPGSRALRVVASLQRFGEAS